VAALLTIMTRKVTRPPKPAARRPTASEPVRPLRPVSKRIGEGQGNLKARANAFDKRRRRSS
jgi:hypothetical protein